jgi:adenylate kinase
LLRENIRQNTSLGQEAKGYMDKGQLVPDPLILQMLFKRIDQKDCEKGYMLDGFPRTIVQAEALEKHLKNEKLIAVDLKLSDEIIIERLTKRISCEKCGTPYHLIFSPPKKVETCDKCGGHLIQRNDDKEEVIKQRLAVYHKQTAPLIDYYAKKKVLHTIQMDAAKSKEKTFEEILAIVEKK